jgi:XTP/dITP diphosphohydrolase
VKALLVSGNPGKLRELRRLLPSWEIEALDTTGIGDETGSSFEDNARAKARWGRRRSPDSNAVIGEDSGLEVDGLGGAPGIRSARFAGPDATDSKNVARLLADLDGLTGADRRARYVCAIVLVTPDGSELVAHGTLEGSIASAPAGTAGFGYDPVFVPNGETRTVGELGEQWKDRNSHRARAAASLAAAVAEPR